MLSTRVCVGVATISGRMWGDPPSWHALFAANGSLCAVRLWVGGLPGPPPYHGAIRQEVFYAEDSSVRADCDVLLDAARDGRRCALPRQYPDGRPAATFRLDAVDHGVVLHHGDGPGQCDIHGARDVWVYEADGTYYMHYDAAGPKGWLAALATSKDLIHWQKKGPVLELGKPGENDSASASYGTTYYDGRTWHMFYLGTPHATPAPDLVPAFPYLTMKAKSTSPAGPWTKQHRRDAVSGTAGHLLLGDRQPRPDRQAGRRVPHVLQRGDGPIRSDGPSASPARRTSTAPGPSIPSRFCPQLSRSRTRHSTSRRRTRPGSCSPTTSGSTASSTPTRCGSIGARTWTAGIRPTRRWSSTAATAPGPSTSSACRRWCAVATGWLCSTTATGRRRCPGRQEPHEPRHRPGVAAVTACAARAGQVKAMASNCASLQDKIGLVTGGSRGIGRAVALALAEAGAKVAINYRTHAAEADAVCARSEPARPRHRSAGRRVGQRSRSPGWSGRSSSNSGRSPSW